jgi:hypothetical protein
VKTAKRQAMESQTAMPKEVAKKVKAQSRREQLKRRNPIQQW